VASPHVPKPRGTFRSVNWDHFRHNRSRFEKLPDHCARSGGYRQSGRPFDPTFREAMGLCQTSEPVSLTHSHCEGLHGYTCACVRVALLHRLHYPSTPSENKCYIVHFMFTHIPVITHIGLVKFEIHQMIGEVGRLSLYPRKVRYWSSGCLPVTEYFGSITNTLSPISSQPQPTWVLRESLSRCPCTSVNVSRRDQWF